MLILYLLNFRQKMSFLTVKSVFCLSFSYQKDRFPHDYVQKCTICCINRSCWSGPFQIFVLAPSFFFFLTHLLSLPFAFHILSGWSKKLGVNYGQNQEKGPWLIIGKIRHFTTMFLHQAWCNVVFQFATPECRRYLKLTVVRINLS